MRLKTIKLVALLLSVITVTGCGLVPSPTSAVMPPKYNLDPMESEGIVTIANKFKPGETEIVEPENPHDINGIYEIDVDGDGKNEIFLTYKYLLKSDGAGCMLLKKQDGEWKVCFTKEFKGYFDSLDWASFVNITGDSRLELLLAVSSGVNNRFLNIYSFKNDSGLLFSGSCTRFELINSGNTEKYNIALWNQDSGMPYTDLFSWDNGEMVPALDSYPDYFKEVVVYYYEADINAFNRIVFLYYLAEAQYKAGLFEDVLATAEESVDAGYLPLYQEKIKIYKAAALVELGEYDQADGVFKDMTAPFSVFNNSLKYKLPVIYLHMGRMYICRNDYAKAEEYLNKGLAITKDIYEIDHLSLAYYSYPIQRELERIKKLKEILN